MDQGLVSSCSTGNESSLPQGMSWRTARLSLRWDACLSPFSEPAAVAPAIGVFRLERVTLAANARSRPAGRTSRTTLLFGELCKHLLSSQHGCFIGQRVVPGLFVDEDLAGDF